jgi:hypothetical protein
MGRLKILLLLFILGLIYTQCSDPISSPPDIAIDELLSAPDTLRIGNQELVLSTFLWRDFQPVSPPNGKPLIALVFIETCDSSEISSKITSDALYIVNKNNVWKSFFTGEALPPDQVKPYRITEIARDGPKWDPHIYVEVVVRIRTDNKMYLLRASEQYIEMTQ